VLNAASYEGGGVAPGEIVTILGSRLGPTDAAVAAIAGGRLPTSLSSARVLVDCAAVPLLYASETAVNAVMPLSIAGRDAVAVQVEYAGIRSHSVTVPVLPAAPGVVYGRRIRRRTAIVNCHGRYFQSNRFAAP